MVVSTSARWGRSVGRAGCGRARACLRPRNARGCRAPAPSLPPPSPFSCAMLHATAGSEAAACPALASAAARCPPAVRPRRRVFVPHQDQQLGLVGRPLARHHGRDPDEECAAPGTSASSAFTCSCTWRAMSFRPLTSGDLYAVADWHPMTALRHVSQSAGQALGGGGLLHAGMRGQGGRTGQTTGHLHASMASVGDTGGRVPPDVPLHF